MSNESLTNSKSLSKTNRWISSLNEFKILRNVVFCGMMAAVAIVLGLFTTINIGNYIRIGFSGLPNQVVDFLFGPAVGAIFGAALDILKWFVKPSGDFFPGFTISAALGGIIYGFAFYKKPVSLKRIIVAETLVKVFVNICLNSIWLKMLYNQAIIAMLGGRVLKNVVMLPIDVFITFTLLSVVEKTIKPLLQNKR